jgi:hypothetical protein
MPRIRITKANELNHLPVTNGVQSADIPLDGEFHEIHEDLLGVLDDSSVEYELENADAPSGSAAAEGAPGLGGQGAPSPAKPRRPRKAKK